MFHRVALLGALFANWVQVLHAVRHTSLDIDAEHALQASATDTRICSQDIVDETGMMIDNRKYNGKGHDICSKPELQELLAAGAETMNQLWKRLHLPDAPSCKEVCQAVAHELDIHGRLPPRSDLGCILVAGQVECDIDLSEASISQLANYTGDIPDFHDEDVMTVEEQKEEAERRVKEISRLETEDDMDHVSNEARDEWNLLRTVANLFRIFPPSHTSVEVTSEGGSMLELEKVSKLDFDVSDVKRTNEKAQACLSTTIRRFNSRQTEKSINRWFGPGAFSDEQGRRKELRRLLNSVHNMLGNTAFVYPGDKCSDKIYAYVHPRSGSSVKAQCDGLLPAKDEKCVKNSQGQFLIFLCDLYIKKPEERIETLLHEGSHHATAFTDDVCMDSFYHGSVEEIFSTVPKSQIAAEDLKLKNVVFIAPPPGYPDDTYEIKRFNGEVMAQIVKIEEDSVELKFFTRDYGMGPSVFCHHKGYGRTPCMSLAKLSQRLAIKNADSLCYYISDVSSDVSQIPKSDASDCQAAGKFCVGATVTYQPVGGRGDITDGHGSTIRSNFKGVVLYPGGQGEELINVRFQGSRFVVSVPEADLVAA
eukprot:TRINITY_DN19382_c1_g1_i1.p1 TRINITY_DN19382_c1_g1~~TRINITY_DN19382_c1_g1_i1.p1  ORF type:complete len:623 (+),score=105.42 TRINITY_DN19382_c1_g1_i1:96-1871(+)